MDDHYTVSIYTSPLSFPLWFVVHTHFVTEHNGIINRYELSGHITKQRRTAIAGHIFKNILPPTTGLFIWGATSPVTGWGPRWQAKLHSTITGDKQSPAYQLFSFIENGEFLQYPDRDKYRMVAGPNSNTFPQWVLDQVPDTGLTLPWNAWGKGYKK